MFNLYAWRWVDGKGWTPTTLGTYPTEAQAERVNQKLRRAARLNKHLNVLYFVKAAEAPKEG